MVQWTDGGLWKRLAGEFTVIVLGVLTALAVDQWAQGRDDHVAEASYLLRIEEDLVADSAMIAGRQRENEEVLERLRSLFDASRTSDPVDQRDPTDLNVEGYEYDSWEPGGQSFVLLNDGGGDFEARVDFGGSTDRTGSIALGDLDQDGMLEIVVAHGRGESHYSYDGPGSEFWFDRLTPGYYGAVFDGDVAEGYALESRFSAVMPASDLTIGDVNADGFPDIAVAGPIMSAVFLNLLGPSVGRWEN